MSDGRGQEYLDENFCSHDDVYIHDFWVKDETLLGADAIVTIRCQNCGKTQERTLCIEGMLENLDLEWEE